MELWIPYGDIETLITLQAENLAEVLQAPQDNLADEEVETLAHRMSEFGAVAICDYKPPTIEVLRRLANSITQREGLKIFASNTKRIESSVPELKGRMQDSHGRASLSNEDGIELRAPPHLMEQTPKLILATAEPDPLFGLIDANSAFCLSFVTNAREVAYRSRNSDEPRPFLRTSASDALQGIAERFVNAAHVTIVPRGSKPHRVLEDAPFEVIKNSFVTLSAPQTRAAIIGAGGRGYDDTLSSALRLIWGSLNCVRPSGEILIICECRDGLGSDALKMLVEGRLDEDGPKKREGYVQGQEELQYLKRLKSTYGIILMSGLPELYARAKLGFTTARGSGEAVGKLLGRLGRTTKVNVVTRACECSISGS